MFYSSNSNRHKSYDMMAHSKKRGQEKNAAADLFAISDSIFFFYPSCPTFAWKYFSNISKPIMHNITPLSSNCPQDFSLFSSFNQTQERKTFTGDGESGCLTSYVLLKSLMISEELSP